MTNGEVAFIAAVVVGLILTGDGAYKAKKKLQEGHTR
jgi:hypothetical protein